MSSWQRVVSIIPFIPLEGEKQKTSSTDDGDDDGDDDDGNDDSEGDDDVTLNKDEVEGDRTVCR